MDKISKNFVRLFFGEGLSHLFGFITNAYIARILGVEGFGLINYSLAFLTYLLLFSNIGFTTLGTREVSREQNDNILIGTITGARFTLTLLLFIFFLSLLTVIPGTTQVKTVILFYLFTGIPYAFNLEFVFQAREEMGIVATGKIIQSLGYLIFILILLRNPKQILTIPIAFFAGYTIATILLIFFFIKRYKRLYVLFNFSAFANLLSAALPIGLATIIYQAVFNLPTIWLRMLYGEKEVGLFSAGFKIVLLLLIIERVFYYLVFPILSRASKKNPAHLPLIIELFTLTLMVITLIVALGVGIFASKIIGLIYGTNFIAATPVLRILLLYFITAPLNTLWGYALVALNQERKFFKVIFLIALMNLLMIPVLSYLFKGTGVALAIFLSEFIGLLIMRQKLSGVIQFRMPPPVNLARIKEILNPF
ncbi:MAG: flippase [candidate division WOR-3 bacterium]